MKLRSALLAATVVALPFAAQAQPPIEGLYVSAGGGVNIKANEDMTNFSIPAFPSLTNNSGNLQSEVGPAFELSIGWGFGNGLRAEIEGNYYNNKYNKLSGLSFTVPGVGTTSTVSPAAGGREQLYGVMANVLYDFNDLSPYFIPYVGVGVGYEAANLQSFRAYAPGNTVNFTTNDTHGGFAYQAIVGAAIPISAIPGLDLTAEYRFMGLAGDRSYTGTATVTSGGTTASAPGGFKLSNDYNNTFLVGFRYAFNQPAPPPPPPAPMAAPAPAPARSYLVFFDWDKATLTTRARQIIHEAAVNSTHVKYTQIEVNGYTDTSGTAKYNMGLSIRRANAVAAELVRDGVPKNVIAIRGFGETHLLVPTGPGVREPQNRRVEIIIH